MAAHGAIRPCRGEAIWSAADRAYLEVIDLYVVEEHRSAGIGAALFRALEALGRDAGATRVLVSSATRDIRRILQFYESLGLQPWSVTLYR